jgi:hypothetical protein
MLTSYQIGVELEDRVERLLVDWSIRYVRGHCVSSNFGSRSTLDFWLPATTSRSSVVLECKNFGVSAKSPSNSRGRKAQEAFYLLAYVRRYCPTTAGAKIIVVTGDLSFSVEQEAFLSAELGPDFHIVGISEMPKLHILLS